MKAVDENKIRGWLEAGGYELRPTIDSAGRRLGYIVTKGGAFNVVYPSASPAELNQGEPSLEKLVADVWKLLPGLGDPPTE